MKKTFFLLLFGVCSLTTSTATAHSLSTQSLGFNAFELLSKAQNFDLSNLPPGTTVKVVGYKIIVTYPNGEIVIFDASSLQNPNEPIKKQ